MYSYVTLNKKTDGLTICFIFIYYYDPCTCLRQFSPSVTFAVSSN